MSAVLALFLRGLSSLALYAFLGWAFWSLWRDLQAGGAPAIDLHIPQLELILQEDGAEKSFSSIGSAVSIGRDPANTCAIPDPTVSTYHAQLSFHHSQWWLRDLESRNGTFLNQLPVHEAVVVTHGDRLRCGQVLFELRIEAFSDEAPLSKP